MALFLARSTHKVDRKGRVSVPAAFRSALGEAIADGISLTQPVTGEAAIEAAPMAQIHARLAQLDTLPPESADRKALAMMMLGTVDRVSIDGDGRIILPEELKEFTGIDDMAVFVGLGHTFQIWEPEALKAYMIEAAALARKSAAMLPSLSSLGLAGQGS